MKILDHNGSAFCVTCEACVPWIKIIQTEMYLNMDNTDR